MYHSGRPFPVAFDDEMGLKPGFGCNSLPADGADKLPLGGHVQGRLQIVALGTPVAGQPGVHKPQAVQKLCGGEWTRST